MELEPPTVNSLLIAEKVYRDGATNVWVIAGVFSEIVAAELPQALDFQVFFQITNVRRAVDLHLRVEHAETGEVVAEMGGPMSCENPLRVVETCVRFHGLRFGQPGKYWVQLLSRSQILTQAPLFVTLAEERPHEQAGTQADE